MLALSRGDDEVGGAPADADAQRHRDLGLTSATSYAIQLTDRSVEQTG